MSTLHDLARLWNVETAYVNTFGQRVEASDDTLRAVLRARGAFAEGDDVARAIGARENELARRMIEPVVVITSGLTSTPIACRLARGARVEWELRGEAGETFSGATGSDGTSFNLQSPIPLASGYYDLCVGDTSARLLVAPRTAHRTERSGGSFGVFAPLYALHDGADCGIGDLRIAGRLLEWVAACGASAFATLPLLATYLDEPFDPSPYAPVSRLFWNEIFLDLETVTGAKLLPDELQRVDRAREAPLVDYREVAALKRLALERALDARSESLRPILRKAIASRPALAQYARFRAVTDELRLNWRRWVDLPRGTKLSADIADPRRVDYHLFAQLEMEQQLEQLSTKSKELSCALFLDFPLGSSAEGFDVYSQAQYVDEVSIGAPPDLSFAQGQDWGFRPADPDAMRAEGYRHWIDLLRHSMRFASMLRLDHVMSLYRLYWIPRGAAPSEGAYVRSRADEMFAILRIESQRSACDVVGEDLGTVPDEIRTLMRDSAIDGMYVLQRMLSHYPDQAPAAPADDRIASINNHDLPPFAAFLSGEDLIERAALGVIAPDRVEVEREKRRRALARLRETFGDLPADQLLRRAVRWLRASPARMTLVSLEDLWLETTAQNIPTTSWQRPNWRPKVKRALPEILASDHHFRP